MASLAVGQFCRSTANDLGFGKALGAELTSVQVEYFDHVAPGGRVTHSVPRDSVRRVSNLPPQTRCYVPLEAGGWMVGRVIAKADNRYHIRFPNQQDTLLEEEDFWIRWNRPIRDPVDSLVAGGHETPHFAECRHPFVNEITRQRAASRGLTGILSSVVELHPHQIDVAARVLMDPIPRYLLADEVGLGKTIEAGMVIRQTILDRPSANVAVIVPRLLVAQWQEELRRRFLADAAPEEADDSSLEEFDFQFAVTTPGIGCQVLPHDEPETWPDASTLDLVVVDEVHHLAAGAFSENAREQLRYQALAQLAHHVPALLLLSATPLLHNEHNFLAMLHLLDPALHRLEDLDRFRAMVQDRRRLGLVFQAFRSSAPPFLLREHCAFLREAFPKDERLSQHLMRVETSLAEAQGLDEAVRSARTHISETYRLHRRVLRTRRDSPRCSEFPVRGRQSPTVVTDPDPFRQSTHPWLEAWLEQVHADHSAQTDALAGLVEAFLEAAGSLPEVLAQQAQIRLRGDAPDSRQITTLPTSHDESVLLRRIVREIDSLPPGRTSRAGLILRVLGAAPGSQKLVLFSGFPTAARLMADLCEREFGRLTVARHTSDMATDTVDLELKRFEQDPSCRFLISDRSGEEGRNLQHAAALIHIDLPWNPNRLEQRIGRLDRYGARAPAYSVVFIPSSNDSYERAWYDCLRSGFGVFDQSIATLQYVTDNVRRELLTALPTTGTSAIRATADMLSNRLAEERKAIAEIEAIESIDEESQVARGLHADLNELEGHWYDLQVATDNLMCDRPGSLRFRRLVKDQQPAVRRYSMVPPGANPNVDNMPLVSWDRLISDFKPALDHWGTFSRVLATRNPGVRLYRLGDSLIDALDRYTRWDDRGKSYALWRCEPVSSPESVLAFRLDFIVEADLSAAVASAGLSGAGAETLSRRADRFLPPLLRTMWINREGEVITEPALLEILQRPYSPQESRDWNLSAERRWLLEQTVGLEWADLCMLARTTAEQSIRSSPTFHELVGEAVSQARAAIDDAIEQFRLREHAGLGIDPTWHLEQAVREPLLEGLASPLIRLDSIGVVLLANHMPQGPGFD